jgi:mannose-1-phosphate guanylyltransferase
MEAILLVGGFGTRLLPLTKTIPKPLIPLANVPFLERTISRLRDQGIDHVIMSLHYSAEQFIEHFRRLDLGVEFSFAIEESPLGTGGAIKNCEPHLRASSNCFIFNGDIFTDLHLAEMLDAHRRLGAGVSIALKEVDDPSRYGVIEMDAESRILSFVEKPPRELARSRNINAGIYIFEPEIFDRFPPGPHSVERDVFPRLLDDGMHLVGYHEPCYWTDLGTPDDYLQAHRDILQRRVQVPLSYREVFPQVWMGDGVKLADDAFLRPPVLLGDGTEVESGATVGPMAVLGEQVHIGAEALIEDSILWGQTRVQPQSHVRGCIIGRQASVTGINRDRVCEDAGILSG